jgi:hypothetical protein
MTEVTSILSGSDNLWKYLFTMGVLLISISIIYPLKQSEIIDLKVMDLRTDSKITAQKIKQLKDDNHEFILYKNIANREIDSLKSLKVNKLILEKIDLIKSEIGQERKKIKEKILNIELLIIENEGKENHVVVLESQSKKYKMYFQIGFWFGVAIMLIGLVKWCIATIASDKLRWKELGLNETSLFKNPFTKK